ncbi:MAG: hypothetical protein LH630_02065 [Actinomycetia bacterium]|nr:hypothetical protein [Actinomycetes bacterium]
MPTRTAAPADEGRTKGRTARTKGVSMQPDELADVVTVEKLTGVGLSELYHRHFAPQLKAAADLLRDADEAGVELNRAVLRERWDLNMAPRDLTVLYTAESELALGE